MNRDTAVSPSPYGSPILSRLSNPMLTPLSRLIHVPNMSELTKNPEFGCGYLPLDSPSSSSSSSSPSSEAAKGPATPVIDGSVMLIRAESLDKAWERIKSDVYWKEGVWDTEKCFVRQFIKNPTYDDLS